MKDTHRILIVDDTPSNIKILHDLLRDIYRISVATNGPDALELIRNELPDMILLDIMMPEMDGYEVCRRLKASEDTAKIPIIFVTAKTEIEDEQKGLGLGAVDYISKPISPPITKARIKNHLELKQSRDRLQEIIAARTKELRLANAKLEIVNRELTTLDEAKNRFLELISHEIRTPLNGILGVTDLLQEMLGEDLELAEFLDMLQISADRLEAFSATALTITQLQTKHQVIIKSRLPAISCLEEVFQELREKAVKKYVALERVVADESLEMDADQELIHRVLRSILDNAIRYSPESSEVICTISMEEGNLVFEVVDKGKGFSEEALKNLFKPFGLGEPHYDQNVGLSLLAAKLIMEAHGGTIKAANREGGGAVVRLAFPSVS